jgi:hypothetical protein
MNYTVTSSDQNQDDYVSSLLRAAGEKHVETHHDIGAATGSLALFGRPRCYSGGSKPSTWCNPRFLIE